MCGIAGFIHIDKEKVQPSLIKKMTDSIAHRGPDGSDLWIDENNRVGLGHRRLSIIDLSHNADQPMHYLGRYTIIFNGEIYNYIELKEDLLKQGYQFRTTSDTEVLMALYDKHKDKCLPLLDGMFAFAIYDAVEKKLFCARDRFGEKPFFYAYKPGNYFLFASEMKALWAVGVEKEIDHVMMYNFLAHGHTENPGDPSQTFYKGCVRLQHSHSLTLNTENISLTTLPYYFINATTVNNNISEEAATDRFNDLFFTSVKRRMRSDVPVGSSLSGGLDSSLTVCVMSEILKDESAGQKTFSAVFPGFAKDERKYIDIVVQKTGVSPYFVTPTVEGLINDIDALIYHQEEPIGSASIYLQYCVMKLAKEQAVTVLLDGQGADEMLAGYHHYYKPFFSELLRNDKALFKTEQAGYLSLHGDSKINPAIHTGFKSKLISYLQPYAPAIKISQDAYEQFRNPFFGKEFWSEYKSSSFAAQKRPETLNDTLKQSLMHRGLQELLRYADRNSMAHSREVRLPFLSHELVDFVFTLPSHFKIHNGWTKWIMRQATQNILPKEIGWRADKIGYEAPQAEWMNNKKVKEIIEASRDGLIKKNILHTSLKNKPVEAHQQTDHKNKTWRAWMAGALLTKS